MNPALTATLLLLATGTALANDPLDPYRAAYREAQSVLKQALECGWGFPFVLPVTQAASGYPLDMAEVERGKGASEKVVGDFKPLAKPCNSAEDKAAQSRAAEMMFDWANRLAAMNALMKKEEWAKDLVKIDEGARAIEPWRAGYQKLLIEKRGQPVWEDYFRRIQAESAQALALVCRERMKPQQAYEQTKFCPAISETLAKSRPLAKVRIDTLEWLSPELAAHDRGEIGGPRKFVDDTNATSLINANIGFLQCGITDRVIFPDAHKLNPDGTLTATVRKYKRYGQYGTVKLKKQANGFDYHIIEADSVAKTYGVQSGEFRFCSTPTP